MPHATALRGTDRRSADQRLRRPYRHPQGRDRARERDLFQRPAGSALGGVAGRRRDEPKALAAYFDKVVPIVAKEARQLAELPRPQQRQATLNHYIAAVGASVAEYRAAARAAAAGDDGGVTQALAKLQSGGATRYARAYGLTQCTGAPSATS